MNYSISSKKQYDRNDADILVLQGKEQFNDLDFDNALKSYEQALDIYQQLSDRKNADLSVQINKIIVITNIGLVYFELFYSEPNQHKQALDLLELALNMSREIQYRLFEANCLHNIAWVLSYHISHSNNKNSSDDNHFDENSDLVKQVLDLYQQALDIRKQINEKADIADTSQNMGAIYEYIGKFEKARELYQQAIAIYKELEDGEEKIATLIRATEVKDVLSEDDPFYPTDPPTVREGTGDPSNPPTVSPPNQWSYKI